MDATEFLTALYGDGVEGSVSTVTHPPFKECTSFHSDPADAARRAMKLDDEGRDVYHSVALYSRDNIDPGGRGTASDVVAITALWADLDYGPSHKKKGYPETPDDCGVIIERLGLAPTIIVRSGHGLHPYWLFKEPLLVSDGAASMARRWGETIKAAAHSCGWAADNVSDLARILRTPGTTNRKNPDKPITVTAEWETGADGKRLLPYNVPDIEAVLVAEDYAATNIGAVTHVDFLDLHHLPPPPHKKLKAACQEDRFRKTWDRKRTDMPDTSASAYDMALAHACVAIEMTDEEIAATIREWRRKHSEDLGKTYRRKYVQDTIGKARAAHESEVAAAGLEHLPDPDPEDPHDPQRTTILDFLSRTLGVAITRWVQHGEEVGDYYLHLTTGEVVRIGSIADVKRSCGERFCERVTDVAHVVPRVFKKTTWQVIVAKLTAIVEVVSSEEDTPVGRVRGWVTAYVKNAGTDVNQALEFGRPVWRADVIHVPADNLCQFVNDSRTGVRLTPWQLRAELRQAGFEPTSVGPTGKARLKSRKLWRDNDGIVTPNGEKPRHDDGTFAFAALDSSGDDNETSE